MMQITPAIFILDGKCSKLGRSNKITYYDENPLDFALKLQDQGFNRIHIVDLNGAQTGRITNIQTVELIAGHTSLDILFGGGITYDEDVRMAFECGASQLTAASIAAQDRDMFSSWLVSFGRNSIILSVDAYDEKVLVKGRQKTTEYDVLEFIEYFYERSVLYVKCSEVFDEPSKDRPFNIYKKIRNKFPDIKLIASGGIKSTEQIETLQQLGVSEVILGNALFDGSMSHDDLKPFLISKEL